MNASSILKYERELVEAGICPQQAAIHAKNVASYMENVNHNNMSTTEKVIKGECWEVAKDIANFKSDLMLGLKFQFIGSIIINLCTLFVIFIYLNYK